MATPKAEVKEEVIPLREQLLAAIAATYSDAEKQAMAHVHAVADNPFKYIDTEPVVTESIRTGRQKIVEDSLAAILEIRKGEKTLDDLWQLWEPHSGELAYRFLLMDNYPGVNVRGSGVFMAILEPVTYGLKIASGSSDVRGRISERSAKPNAPLDHRGRA